MSNYENIFFKALRVRRVEEKVAEIYPTDIIQSPVHLSIGQEHVSVGVIANLNNTGDKIYPTYRGHAAYLAKGGSLRKFFSELFGRVDGYAKGKGGSMHIAEKENYIYPSSAILGSTFPHAVGTAYSEKLAQSGNIVVKFYGEGVTGAGSYHESLNLASHLETPILFVCEFNDMNIYTAYKAIHKYDILKHAESYGIEAFELLEGWDLEKIETKSKILIEKIRKDHRPRLLMVHTCRYLQHVGPSSDDRRRISR